MGSKMWKIINTGLSSVLLFKRCCFIYVYIMFWVGLCTHECRCLQRLKEGAGPLQLQYQEVMSQPAWVLGTELRTFARTVHALFILFVCEAGSLLKSHLKVLEFTPTFEQYMVLTSSRSLQTLIFIVSLIVWRCLGH